MKIFDTEELKMVAKVTVQYIWSFSDLKHWCFIIIGQSMINIHSVLCISIGTRVPVTEYLYSCTFYA